MSEHNATISNTIFYRDTTTSGRGTIYVGQASVDFKHCLFTELRSEAIEANQTAAIENSEATVNLYSSIVWNNSAAKPSDRVDMNANNLIAGSNIDTAHIGNLFVDNISGWVTSGFPLENQIEEPIFTDPVNPIRSQAEWFWHTCGLMPTSTALKNSGVYCHIDNDITNAIRSDGEPDIGPYESP
jgi:hypothetical protein